VQKKQEKSLIAACSNGSETQEGTVGGGGEKFQKMQKDHIGLTYHQRIFGKDQGKRRVIVTRRLREREC